MAKTKQEKREAKKAKERAGRRLSDDIDFVERKHDAATEKRLLLNATDLYQKALDNPRLHEVCRRIAIAAQFAMEESGCDENDLLFALLLGAYELQRDISPTNAMMRLQSKVIAVGMIEDAVADDALDCGSDHE
jgi:hypothetical protein